MSIFSKKSQGFSLLEVLLSVFIFSVIMLGVTSYFVSIVSANQNSKRLQQNLEDIRFAMNRIAKVLRTSVVVIPTSISNVTTIRVFDYSQSKCLQYTFAGNSIGEYSQDLPAGRTDEKPWCASLLTTGFTQNILVNVASGASMTGRFVVIPSDDGSGGSEFAGRVTMNANVVRQGNSSTVQTTVSLRNYEEVYHP